MSKENSDRFMIYLQNRNFSSGEANSLLKKIRNLIQSDDVIVRDCRVSSSFIELDVSIYKKGDIENFTKKIQSIGSLREIHMVKEKDFKKDELIVDAIGFFNDEKYWLAHEALETVWKRSFGREKEILNGLILICAAFVHDQKNEQDICLSILDRALRKLSVGNKDYYHKIDLANVHEKTLGILQTNKIIRFTL